MITKDKYVGTIINGFFIESRDKTTTNDGHATYSGYCVGCGFKFKNCKIWDLKRTNTGVTHNHIAYRCNWYDPQIGRTFHGIQRRCYDKNDKSFIFYGAKGIKNEFSPEEFNNWCIKNGFRPGLSIDRIDPSKNYSPDNCR